MLLIRGSGPPNITASSFGHETYFLLCQGFIRAGIFDQAIILYLNSQTDRIVEHRLTREIKLIQSPSNDILNQEYFDFVFIRAEFQEYPHFLKNIKWGKLGFYLAQSRVLPQIINPKLIDIIYINHPSEKRLVKLKYPHIKTRVLDKPVDDKIFRPQNLTKKYDICCLANFRPRKHFTMLYEAINKLPNHKNLKIVVNGNLFMSGYDAQMLAGEYELDITYTGLVDIKQVAKYLNQSKFNVLASKLEGNPRALYESIACNTPILINSEMTSGTQLVNRYTGVKAKLWEFDKALVYMLKNYKKFKPYEYFKQELTLEKIINKLSIDLK